MTGTFGAYSILVRSGGQGEGEGKGESKAPQLPRLCRP